MGRHTDCVMEIHIVMGRDTDCMTGRHTDCVMGRYTDCVMGRHKLTLCWAYTLNV